MLHQCPCSSSASHHGEELRAPSDHMPVMLQGCPCSSSALCQADTDSVMYNHSDCDSEWPYISHVPSPGYWYFIHGGAGAITSRGLMDITSYERCHDFIFGPMPRMSGGQPPPLPPSSPPPPALLRSSTSLSMETWNSVVVSGIYDLCNSCLYHAAQQKSTWQTQNCSTCT